MAVRMDQLSWKEFAERSHQPVILPIGSTEQHGQHLPMGVDTILAECIATDLAERIDGTLMPTLSYGYKSRPQSGGGPLFPGTIDLNGSTVIAQVRDVLRELIDDGFRNILVLNAHFENEAFILEAIDLVNRETGGVATVVETNWWDPLTPHDMEAIFDGLPFPGWALEHAAVTETSLMLHYAPELVHLDRVPTDTGTSFAPAPYVRYPVRPGDVPAHGGLASPAGASAERGQLIVEACMRAVVSICEQEFVGRQPEHPALEPQVIEELKTIGTAS
ncbi:creatininase [Rothia sp. (in: high G+C Gram-positive bacteria)]|uniref:creatininase n=1 Tax=Rothia sp. (in: high G+C Gram-positive bacteria) TaxID=1885016 RepID=UPI003217E803